MCTGFPKFGNGEKLISMEATMLCGRAKCQTLSRRCANAPRPFLKNYDKNWRHPMKAYFINRYGKSNVLTLGDLP
jgi:hypothetical protein